MSKSQNQVTKTIETQTECETRSERDNEDDSNADIKSIKKSPLHPRDWLKQKVSKFRYS